MPREADEGDETLRRAFREILESDLIERSIRAGALLLGILLSVGASVVGSLA